MPLFPPAKRNWEGRTLQLPCGATSITWPPTNWQQMSADQRLLQWEFAAMQFQSVSPGNQILDRLELLAHYNMLALPGTAIPSLKPTAVHKMRFYNYDVIRRIAVTASCSADDVVILRQVMEASKHRSKSTDALLRFLQGQKIALRL
ncbi:hypothetical protein FSP39_017196 [Pinctada imbricata]|uniref:Uncharacterized protein n=1 Tax=Pinctada imbricata TaxID=66713 RepID=A0AA88XW29_PINIB|nr:hypothetical protein FSP39_017196 [Pinctada imbricata]